MFSGHIPCSDDKDDNDDNYDDNDDDNDNDNDDNDDNNAPASSIVTETGSKLVVGRAGAGGVQRW